MSKPVIGISLDLLEDDHKYSYSLFPWYALRRNYSDAVSQHGAIPIFLPCDAENIEHILSLIDGLIIPGGDWDIDPKFFNERVLSERVILNHERTKYDILLAQKALERNISFLGICYGMQLMNVIKGGSLIQDIKEMVPGSLNHEQPHPKNVPSHAISIIEGTKLFDIAKCQKEHMVNSTHHQAIKALGNDLVVSAMSPDGIIEAIESTNHKFAIGIEWHPEYCYSELDKSIFQAFINSCNK